MELVVFLLIVLVAAYPYILLLRLMRLACKALRKYLDS